MSRELWQIFSAECLLLLSHISKNYTWFCFPQTCIFHIGLFLTFQLLLIYQLSAISLMVRLSRAFLEYFNILREEISYLIMLLLDGEQATYWIGSQKDSWFKLQLKSFPTNQAEQFVLTYTHLFLRRRASNLLLQQHNQDWFPVGQVAACSTLLLVF